MNTTTTTQDRYNEVIATFRADASSHADKRVCTVRQNRQQGPPDCFEQAAIPINRLHFLSLSVARKPSGEAGLLFRLNDAKAPTAQFPDTIAVGGQGKQQALAKWLDNMPTADGRGPSFAWSDELLSVALDMAEVLFSNPVSGPAQLPRVLGTKPQRSLLESLQAAAETPRDYIIQRAQCTGEVTYVTDSEQGLPGYVRIVQQPESLQPLATESLYAEGEEEFSESVPQGFQPLVAEENAGQCDEVAILPGTRSVVTVGQTVDLGDPILELDPATVGQLSESQMADLVAMLEFAIKLGHCDVPVVEAPTMYVGKLPLYAGNGTAIPRGDVLYFDIVDLVAADGSPVYQILDAGNGILTADNLRYDLRPTAISYPRQKDFVRPSAATIRQQEVRQRNRRLRGLGEEVALAQLVTEAQAMPVQAYDLKLDHLSSGPFPLSEAMALVVHTFSMNIRMGVHRREEPVRKAELINEFLQAFSDFTGEVAGEEPARKAELITEFLQGFWQ